MYALVDCNNFYGSCERLFNPKAGWQGKNRCLGLGTVATTWDGLKDLEIKKPKSEKPNFTFRLSS